MILPDDGQLFHYTLLRKGCRLTRSYPFIVEKMSGITF